MPQYICRECDREAGTTYGCDTCDRFRKEFSVQETPVQPKDDAPRTEIVTSLHTGPSELQAPSGERARRCDSCGKPSGELDRCMACIDKEVSHLQGPAKGFAKAFKLGFEFLGRED